MRMKEYFRSIPNPPPHLPTRHFHVTQLHTRCRITINFKAIHSLHRRWPVGRALDSDYRGRGLESSRCCFFYFFSIFIFWLCFLFCIFLVLAFIDSSASPLFLFLIRLRFVNCISLEISKSGQNTRLYIAYIIKSCNPYP